MKKIGKIVVSVFAAAMLLSAVSCRGKSNDLDTKNMTEFKNSEFEGELADGKWTVDALVQGPTNATINGTIEVSGEVVKAKLDSTYNGKSEPAPEEMRLVDFQYAVLKRMADFLPSEADIAALKEHEVTYEGERTLLISADKKTIGCKFVASKDGETQKVVLVMNKK